MEAELEDTQNNDVVQYRCVVVRCVVLFRWCTAALSAGRLHGNSTTSSCVSARLTRIQITRSTSCRMPGGKRAHAIWIRSRFNYIWKYSKCRQTLLSAMYQKKGVIFNVHANRACLVLIIVFVACWFSLGDMISVAHFNNTAAMDHFGHYNGDVNCSYTGEVLRSLASSVIDCCGLK